MWEGIHSTHLISFARNVSIAIVYILLLVTTRFCGGVVLAITRALVKRDTYLSEKEVTSQVFCL